MPLADIKPLQRPTVPRENPSAPPLANNPGSRNEPKQSKVGQDLRSPGNIVIVRNRMLYARAALNAKGHVRFGLRHIRETDPLSGRMDASGS